MPYKLLIADDERDITDMLASYFRRRGCEVLTAYGGEEAIALSAREPDLILLDVSMPDVDGLEVCRRIRGKLAAAGAKRYIETVWGCGYRWSR